MHTVPPVKRARRSSSPTNDNPNSNGDASSSSVQLQPQQPHQLPALSLSILGVEPLDEFIKEIADFVHHIVMSRSQEVPNAKVEVEAKIGVLRERTSGQRLALPVLVETSTSPPFMFQWFYARFMCLFFFCLVLSPNFADIRFESNMSVVRLSHASRESFYLGVCSNNTSTLTTSSTN
jgi:hypothetical protein